MISWMQATDLREPIEEIMWKYGFWLSTGYDAAIAKAAGTRNVDELKLKSMQAYETYSKEVNVVACLGNMT